ncbi:uncharacterized protein LOC126839287 isoform X3 [Adelges cooleyi]|uniref:uncharacterized protein LOC126839287 isoform X3 n=1 Tax=Adelges cooleyi TaxID=133065 RepID=UPI00217F9C09|nr:uncharacterized protein LOC126839287 isoform X3 [Adelges cooleyi]
MGKSKSQKRKKKLNKVSYHQSKYILNQTYPKNVNNFSSVNPHLNSADLPIIVHDIDYTTDIPFMASTVVQHVIETKNVAELNQSYFPCLNNGKVLKKQKKRKKKRKNNKFSASNTYPYNISKNINIFERDRLIGLDRKLRPIVIDAENVAYAHSINETFSAKGIQLCIDWFKTHGHSHIKAFIPKNYLVDEDSECYRIIKNLENKGHVYYTPTRENKCNNIHYHRLILEYATQVGAAVVSNEDFTDFHELFSDILLHSFVGGKKCEMYKKIAKEW